jgi:RNA polymerase sigma factor (sigma-70 family)
MHTPATSSIWHLIRKTVEGRGAREAADPELLQRFHAQRDQDAFHALIRRHGPMVLDVCRGVLANEADVEDAFQATFLILVRKAGSIRKTGSLASWLHGVAYRTALKARSQSAVRKKHETRLPARLPSARDEPGWGEVQQVLHEELHGLSERYRAPLVLCYLEGMTQDAAAVQLNLAKSTLRERLERGRAQLRLRLIRRGLGPAALLLAAAWPAARTTAGVPAALTASTLEAAAMGVAGKAGSAVISVAVSSLTEGVIRTMFLTKMKCLSIVLSAMMLLGLGVGTAMLPMPTTAQAYTEPPAQAPANPQGSDRPPPVVLPVIIPGVDLTNPIQLAPKAFEHPITPDLTNPIQLEPRGDEHAIPIDVVRLNAREFKLPVTFKSEERDKLQRVHLYVSPDQGKSWQRVGSITPEVDGFRFTAPKDGLYWFAIQEEYPDGQLRPIGIVPPQLKVLVDTSLSLKTGPPLIEPLADGLEPPGSANYEEVVGVAAGVNQAANHLTVRIEDQRGARLATGDQGARGVGLATITIPPNTPVLIDGRQGKLADVQKHMRVAVQVKPNTNEALEVRATWPKLRGEITFLAGDKITLQVRRTQVLGTEKHQLVELETAFLDQEVKVLISGKQAKVTDLKQGMPAVLYLRADTEEVVWIQAGKQASK